MSAANEITKYGRDYVGYEYKTITVDSGRVPMLLDSYANFGWTPGNNLPDLRQGTITVLNLRRERNILNKAELTRLQQHFEACIDEIDKLENSRIQMATIYSLAVGIIGTAFVAGSVFMVTNEPPLILLCVLLGAPGLVCWAAAYPVFRKMREKRTTETIQLIEKKYDEMHEICAKGSSLRGGKFQETLAKELPSGLNGSNSPARITVAQEI